MKQLRRCLRDLMGKSSTFVEKCAKLERDLTQQVSKGCSEAWLMASEAGSCQRKMWVLIGQLQHLGLHVHKMLCVLVHIARIYCMC